MRIVPPQFEGVLRTLVLLFLTAAPIAGVPGGDFPPAGTSPPQITVPIPPVRVLPNGLRVLLIERHSAPLVALRMMIMSGAEADPQGRAGTAQFVSGLLTEGTEHRSALEIARAVDQAGGTMDAGAGWDESFASISALSDRRELAFDLLADIVIHPAFAPAEIERFRKQTISALRILAQDPGYTADATVRAALFRGTPYSHPDEGTLESNKAITRQDLQNFHDMYYRPRNAVLAVLGDITPQECYQLVEKYFGRWAEREAPSSATAADFKPKPAPGVIVIDKPDAVQSEIRVGIPGIPRSSPDFYSLTVANQILGGPAANRLFAELRTKRGLTYGASSDLRCYRSLGGWIAKTSTRTDETVKAVRAMLEQIKRLRTSDITRQELEMAKDYLVGHEALQFESLDGIASRVLEMMLYDLPRNYWDQFPQQIRDVSAADVLSVARSRLDSARPVIVVVGNAAAFEKGLGKLGPERVIPITRLALGSSDLENPATPSDRMEDSTWEERSLSPP